jgi:hypothetical protein
MNIQIYDNGGKTWDRYCLIVDDSIVYTMTGDSESSKDPKYLCKVIDLDKKAVSKPVEIEDLPKALRNRIESNASKWSKKIHTPRR